MTARRRTYAELAREHTMLGSIQDTATRTDVRLGLQFAQLEVLEEIRDILKHQFGSPPAVTSPPPPSNEVVAKEIVERSSAPPADKGSNGDFSLDWTTDEKLITAWVKKHMPRAQHETAHRRVMEGVVVKIKQILQANTDKSYASRTANQWFASFNFSDRSALKGLPGVGLKYAEKFIATMPPRFKTTVKPLFKT